MVNDDRQNALEKVAQLGPDAVDIETLLLAQQALKERMEAGSTEARALNQFRLFDLAGAIEQRKMGEGQRDRK